MKRIRFLYVILFLLLMASVGPLSFYALKMLETFPVDPKNLLRAVQWALGNASRSSSN